MRLLCVPSAAQVTPSIFQKRAWGQHLGSHLAEPATCCVPSPGQTGVKTHTGVLGGAAGADPEHWAVQGQFALWCLHKLHTLPRLPARQEVHRGWRDHGPTGLISSLLTNPFTCRQAEQDGARREAPQRGCSPTTPCPHWDGLVLQLLLGLRELPTSTGQPQDPFPLPQGGSSAGLGRPCCPPSTHFC